MNTPTPSSTPLRTFEAPRNALDLLRESAPNRAKQTNIPDTSKTDTVRIVTRKFTVKKDTVYRWLEGKKPTARLEQSQPSLTLEATLESLPYNFILLPTVDGRPTVNVNQDRTVIEAIRPDNASSLRITYDHPNPSWEIGPLGSISAIKSNKVYTSGRLGLYLQYRNVRIEPTYRFSPIRNRTGPNLTLEWSIHWISF